MPGFAKFLAFLNVLAAGGFIYLATLDWAARQAWAKAGFVRELMLDGLPVDEHDTGRRIDLTVFADLGDEADPDTDAVLKSLFKPKEHGAPIKTQDAEIERVQKEQLKLLDSLDEKKQRERLRAMLMDQANTFDEREAIARNADNPETKTKDLRAQFSDLFDDAVRDVSQTENRDVAHKRRAIAHLLYNLFPIEDQPDSVQKWHERVRVIVGLKVYVNEAETQAKVLRDMAQENRLRFMDERSTFEVDFRRVRERILEFAEKLDRQNIALRSLHDMQKRHEDAVIAPLDARKKALLGEFEEAKKKTDFVLAKQEELERDLFKDHRTIGQVMEENRKLERGIRVQELGRLRGGSQ